jgi:P-type E1-E2 ATPase
VLVALGGHLVGLLGLQDGLRAGARAAVQHLLDANIEPVLLTGEARKSGEALGRTIDIEHLRPEVLPLERGREVERLKSGGAQVAVIGRSPTDEIALSAASVSIALPSVGTPNLDHDVEIATNEVQRAALALSLARQCRTKALYSIGIAAGGSIATVLATVAISAPIAFAPLGCLLFVMIAAVGTNSQSGDAGSLVTRADDAGDRA